VEKLESLGYLVVKKFEDIFSRFGAAHERDKRTDKRTPHAGNSIAWQKCVEGSDL